MYRNIHFGFSSSIWQVDIIMDKIPDPEELQKELSDYLS